MTSTIQPPSSFYRVSLKALIYNRAQQLLVVQQKNGSWEMPGGGWEFGESIEECITRELLEEVGVRIGVDSNKIIFAYSAPNHKGYMSLKLVVSGQIEIEDANFTFNEQDTINAKFVTKQELLELSMEPDEAGIKQFADDIWP